MGGKDSSLALGIEPSEITGETGGDDKAIGLRVHARGSWQTPLSARRG